MIFMIKAARELASPQQARADEASRLRARPPSSLQVDALDRLHFRIGHDHPAVRCSGEGRLCRIGELDAALVELTQDGEADIVADFVDVVPPWKIDFELQLEIKAGRAKSDKAGPNEGAAQIIDDALEDVGDLFGDIRGGLVNDADGEFQPAMV
jgi:hypothetical protein